MKHHTCARWKGSKAKYPLWPCLHIRHFTAKIKLVTTSGSPSLNRCKTCRHSNFQRQAKQPTAFVHLLIMYCYHICLLSLKLQGQQYQSQMAIGHIQRALHRLISSRSHTPQNPCEPVFCVSGSYKEADETNAIGFIAFAPDPAVEKLFIFPAQGGVDPHGPQPLLEVCHAAWALRLALNPRRPHHVSPMSKKSRTQDGL